MHPQPYGPWTARSFAVLIFALLATMGLTGTAEARTSIVKTGRAATTADHTLVLSAHKAAGCASGCSNRRRAVQRSGRRLSSAAKRLSRVAKASGPARTAKRAAPRLQIGGRKLSWRRVARVKQYVVGQKVGRQRTSYTVVRGTSTTPATVPGARVRYVVRTAVPRSRWSREKAIRYPAKPTAASAEPAAEGAPAQGARTQSPIDAPRLAASGGTLSWNKVADVEDYVVVSRVPGSAETYRGVRGSSVTPEPTPGKRVTFTVRTAVDGSVRAPEVSITYPKAAGETSNSGVTPGSPPGQAPPRAGDFTPGVNSGSSLDYELPFVRALGARNARLAFAINTPTGEMRATIQKYVDAGVRPLLLADFDGTTVTAAEARNVAEWARVFGPGGSFWAGRSVSEELVPREIEFGNETSYSSQYPELANDPDWANTSLYHSVAARYATRFTEAADAVRAVNPRVGLLAIDDTPGNWSSWMDTIYATVPDFDKRVAGWTVHPYGPNWQGRIDDSIAQARTHGAPDTIPFHVTEIGIASDDGRCLSDNYGWGKCLSYAQAGDTLTRTMAGLRARYGSRLASVYLYQAHDQRGPATSSDREYSFGLLKLDSTAKGGLTAAAEAFLAG